MRKGQQSLLRTAFKHSRCTSFPTRVRYLHPSSPRYSASTTALKSSPYITHHSQVTTPTITYNFLDNQFKQSKTDRWIDLHDPATQTVVTRVPETTEEELVAAVDSAEKAFRTWKNTSLLTRQQILFRLAALIRENWDRLAASITLEQVLTRVPTFLI